MDDATLFQLVRKRYDHQSASTVLEWARTDAKIEKKAEYSAQEIESLAGAIEKRFAGAKDLAVWIRAAQPGGPGFEPKAKPAEPPPAPKASS